jgi:hypothetical protein
MIPWFIVVVLIEVWLALTATEQSNVLVVGRDIKVDDNAIFEPVRP